jgi:spore coat protein A, manganese oxidase
VVDTSYHWCYSIKGYTRFSIEENGTPIVPHLHGAHSDYRYDGNPEYFFSPEFGVKGPHWVNETYTYDNSQGSCCLWYHDHALGITRLNVYAGMAGFYLIRDEKDTGKQDNPFQLPAFPYELPLLVQDRMFKETGELFYPSFKGDPYYKDFITDEGAVVGDDDPSALAEFFGDHMVVNGYVRACVQLWLSTKWARCPLSRTRASPTFLFLLAGKFGHWLRWNLACIACVC